LIGKTPKKNSASVSSETADKPESSKHLINDKLPSTSCASPKSKAL
jgi:hypothetical protein